MVQIDIHIPRPFVTLGWIAAIIAVVGWYSPLSFPAEGGSGTVRAQVVLEAEDRARELRIEQEVLLRREEILRYQVELLAYQVELTDDVSIAHNLDGARDHLLRLIADRRMAEEELRQTLREIWDAQGYAAVASRDTSGVAPDLEWPVEPNLGISAHFEDAQYERRFGIPHHAIDIPIDQDSPVYAAADGVVAKVSENGLGFNAITISHSGGVATLYGHVTEFAVEEGQRVRQGQLIAYSGGMPGTPGAGLLSTGPHLHFEVIVEGSHVDPLPYLPDYAGFGGD